MINYRKHFLTAIFGALLLLYAGDWLLHNALEGPLAKRRLRNERVQEKIDKRHRELAQARKESELLTRWEKQSLPSNVGVARSLYQAWLLELVGHVGLANPTVDSSEPASRRDIYQSLSFSVRARGTLDQLTQFLFEFYRAPHLHQIRSLMISPLSASGQLDLVVVVEALVLPGADRVDQLAEGTSDRLASANLADYRVISERNLFGVGGSLDPLEHTRLTAVTSADGQPIAWFADRTHDKKVQLLQGQSLEIGLFKATVVEIREADVILDADGQRWLLTLGDSVADAFALPPES